MFLKLDDEVYRKLEELARRYGLLSASEMVKMLVMKALASSSEGQDLALEHTKRTHVLAEKLVTVVERRLLDKINPFTSKIDDVAKKLAAVIERLEIVEDRIGELERKVKELEERLSHSKVHERAILHRSEGSERRETTKRRSILEILREQGVLFESDIASRIRDRDRFFAKLRKLGAIVLELKNERVAIDPEFWNGFIEKVQSISTSVEDEVSNTLNEKEVRLFKALKESALIYFDRTTGRWKLLV